MILRKEFEYQGFDEIDMIEMVLTIEEEFNVEFNDEQIPLVKKVADVVRLVKDLQKN